MLRHIHSGAHNHTCTHKYSHKNMYIYVYIYIYIYIYVGTIPQICSGMYSVAEAGLIHRKLTLGSIQAVQFDIQRAAVHVKVSEFELCVQSASRDCDSTDVPVRWTAPEALPNCRRTSSGSDICMLDAHDFSERPACAAGTSAFLGTDSGTAREGSPRKATCGRLVWLCGSC